ncbi:MAG: hypothetical protein SNJ71_00390 [Bacteroidales bacterium]
MRIKVYDRECRDGIGEIIEENSSVKFYGEIVKNKTFTSNPCLKNAKASIDEILAQFRFADIHVTSGWNLNDDVFIASDLVNAKNTCVDIPVNLEHDQSVIIGHTIGVGVFDFSYNQIDEKMLIPENIHLMTEFIIYNFWRDLKNAELISNIINEINGDDTNEINKWRTSMECAFLDYDYALKDKEKNIIVKRNEETSFLSKFLKHYGGSGVYKQYKVGRVLRDFAFVGKGLTKNPANPHSVIFTKNYSFLPFSNHSVAYTVNEVDKMEKQEELKNLLLQKESEITKLKEYYENLLSNTRDELETYKRQNENLSKELAKLEKECALLHEQHMKAKELIERNTRLSMLMEKMPRDKAEELVDLLKNLDENSFVTYLNKFVLNQEEPAKDKTNKNRLNLIEDVVESKSNFFTGGSNERIDSKAENLRKSLAEIYKRAKS